MTQAVHPSWCDPPHCDGSMHKSAAVDATGSDVAAFAVLVSRAQSVDGDHLAGTLLEFVDEPGQTHRYLVPAQMAVALSRTLTTLLRQLTNSPDVVHNSVSHPDWCVAERCLVLMADDELPTAIEHRSRVIDLADPVHLPSISLYLRQPAFPVRRPVTVELEVRQGTDVQGFPMGAIQAGTLQTFLIGMA